MSSSPAWAQEASKAQGRHMSCPSGRELPHARATGVRLAPATLRVPLWAERESNRFSTHALTPSDSCATRRSACLGPSGGGSR
eukprot:315500-Prymnesium_polylepis.4